MAARRRAAGRLRRGARAALADRPAAAVREELAALGLPLFVKPARLGSSVGIVKVTDADEIDGALETAFGHDGLVIVEAFSDGMEVECSVLGLAEPEASLPGEIVLKGADWYDYAAKYEPGGMELVVPARIPEAVQEEVRRLARETFVRVGLRRAGAGGLLRRGRAGARQRAQHAAGLHGDERLPEAVGGDRPRVPGAVRPAAAGSRSSASAPSAAATPSSRSARREQRDLGDLDALGARREVGDPDEVVAVALAREAEALALLVDRAAGHALPAVDLLRRLRRRRRRGSRAFQPGSGVSISIERASTPGSAST